MQRVYRGNQRVAGAEVAEPPEDFELLEQPARARPTRATRATAARVGRDDRGALLMVCSPSGPGHRDERRRNAKMPNSRGPVQSRGHGAGQMTLERKSLVRGCWGLELLFPHRPSSALFNGQRNHGA